MRRAPERAMTLSPSGSPTAAPGPFAMSPTRSFTVTPVAVRVVAPGDRFVGRPPGAGSRRTLNAWSVAQDTPPDWMVRVCDSCGQ